MKQQYRVVLLSLFSVFIAAAAAANTQLVLKHGAPIDQAGEYTGVVDLVIDPGVENAKVQITVDGQRVADGLRAPYRIVADFGPAAVQHRISVQVFNANGKRVKQWHETINHGLLPLSVKVQPVDRSARLFEVIVTSPKEDPVEAVQLWHEGSVVATATSEPYQFTVPENVLAGDFVQVTARTKAGEEAADFWSAAGNVHAQELQIRTVPIFVSVVDRNGHAHDDHLDRSQFRILDNDTEGRIVEFGKAFDQPISIALLVDSSASMTYSMQHASKAAAEFVQRALKEGDRCSVTAIQEVPRRKQALTSDRAAVAKALVEIKPAGQTALFDAIGTAVRELREEKNRRAIVLLTDGGDTSSITSYEEIQKIAREAGIPLYFIAYEGGDDQLRDLDRLRFLAAETGGFVATATQQNLMAKYEAIEKDLRAQFAIKYQVSDLGHSNEWRRVRVVIDSPKLTARTIKGYFTP